MPAVALPTPNPTQPQPASDALAPVAAVMAQLDSQVAQLQQCYHAQMNCKAGCSRCCVDGFQIRLAEALLLWQQLCQLPPATLADILQKASSPSTGQCPLVDANGHCSAYASRPALCRAFGVLVQLDDTVATCDLNFTEPSTDTTLEVLNLSPYYAVLEELSAVYANAGGLPETASQPQSIRGWLGIFQHVASTQA